MNVEPFGATVDQPCKKLQVATRRTRELEVRVFVVVAVVVLYCMIRGSICGNGHKERVVCQMMSVNIGRIQASILRESIAPL